MLVWKKKRLQPPQLHSITIYTRHVTQAHLSVMNESDELKPATSSGTAGRRISAGPYSTMMDWMKASSIATEAIVHLVNPLRKQTSWSAPLSRSRALRWVALNHLTRDIVSVYLVRRAAALA